MRDVVYLARLEQAEALLKPQRIEVLRQLAEPRSCTEVAVELDQTPQRAYSHVKRLLRARLGPPPGPRGAGARGARDPRGNLPGGRPVLLAVPGPGGPDRAAPDS